MIHNIYLSNGYFTTVDDVYLNELIRYKWSKVGRKKYTMYACREVMHERIHMHRYILELDGNDLTDKLVDHINGNGLDNRLKNLRVCSHSENSINRTKIHSNNTSGITGVTWNKWNNRWEAVIGLKNERIHIGYYKEKEDAISARRKAEITYHEKFSPNTKRFVDGKL